MKDISVTTIYDEDRIKRFLKVHYFEQIRVPRIILNILIIIVIINFFTKDIRKVSDYLSFVFALLGILELNTSFLPFFNYKKLKKKKDNILNTKIDYVFKKNNLKITNKKDEYIDYKDLAKVIETETDYYLYITSGKSFIVSKDSLSDEEINTLSNNFKDKVKKYGYKKNIR